MSENNEKNLEILKEFLVDEGFSLLKNAAKYFLEIDKEKISENITNEFIDNFSKLIESFLDNLLE